MVDTQSGSTHLEADPNTGGTSVHCIVTDLHWSQAAINVALPWTQSPAGAMHVKQVHGSEWNRCTHLLPRASHDAIDVQHSFGKCTFDWKSAP